MYFPSLTCKVKRGAAVLDVTAWQFAYSFASGGKG
jgi:hypothetical protein